MTAAIGEIDGSFRDSAKDLDRSSLPVGDRDLYVAGKMSVTARQHARGKSGRLRLALPSPISARDFQLRISSDVCSFGYKIYVSNDGAAT